MVKLLKAESTPAEEQVRLLCQLPACMHVACHRCFCRRRLDGAVQAFLVEVSTLARACRHPHLIGYLGWARRQRAVVSHYALGCCAKRLAVRLVASEAAELELLRMMAGGGGLDAFTRL